MGYSRHAEENYAVMCSMPNMLIAAPGDSMEVRASMRYLIARPKPSYLRLGNAGEACFHSEVAVVEPGMWWHVSGHNRVSAQTILTPVSTLGIAMNRFSESKKNNF